MRIFSVTRGHFGKKLFGFIEMDIMVVPVDDDIYSFFNSGIDNRLYFPCGKTGTFQVATIIEFDAHGGADYIAFPVVFQPFNGAGIVYAWPKVVPAEAHAAKDEGIVVFV